MRRFFKRLAESPLAQTWLVIGLLAVIFLVVEVGTWISDNQVAMSYSLVADPFVFILYLVLFLIVHLLLDIAFWCCVAWLLLFLPDIWRYLRRNGSSNDSPR